MSQVCIIIPCYNEESRLNMEAFRSFLDNHNQLDLLFVNDGSTDGTQKLIDQLVANYDTVHQLRLAENRGKAEAIRQGMLFTTEMGKYQLAGYLDADLATPLNQILYLQESILNNPDVHIVLGSRWMRLGSHINRNWLRHYLGRIFATMVSVIFRMEVYDTQCGAKVIRTLHLKKIFSEPFISRWFFDIEILLRMKQVFASPVAQWAREVPISHWNEIGNSRVAVWDFITVPFQLLKIKRHYHSKAR
ncbi:MAG: glycosyltransferase [Saprospiraceae bacterium]|nr:glycosyltransferase [Saprospiraceae bacterium]